MYVIEKIKGVIRTIHDNKSKMSVPWFRFPSIHLKEFQSNRLDPTLRADKLRSLIGELAMRYGQVSKWVVHKLAVFKTQSYQDPGPLCRQSSRSGSPCTVTHPETFFRETLSHWTVTYYVGKRSSYSLEFLHPRGADLCPSYTFWVRCSVFPLPFQSRVGTVPRHTNRIRYRVRGHELFLLYGMTRDIGNFQLVGSGRMVFGCNSKSS